MTWSLIVIPVCGVLDVVMLMFMAFMAGRVYEREHGVFRVSYDKLTKVFDEHIENLRSITGTKIPIRKGDGSMLSPIQIKKVD